MLRWYSFAFVWWLPEECAWPGLPGLLQKPHMLLFNLDLDIPAMSSVAASWWTPGWSRTPTLPQRGRETRVISGCGFGCNWHTRSHICECFWLKATIYLLSVLSSEVGALNVLILKILKLQDRVSMMVRQARLLGCKI